MIWLLPRGLLIPPATPDYLIWRVRSFFLGSRWRVMEDCGAVLSLSVCCFTHHIYDPFFLGGRRNESGDLSPFQWSKLRILPNRFPTEPSNASLMTHSHPCSHMCCSPLDDLSLVSARAQNSCAKRNCKNQLWKIGQIRPAKRNRFSRWSKQHDQKQK